VLRAEAGTTIGYLHAQGMSIRAICRELGILRKALRCLVPPTS
jgi:transposase